MSAALFDAITAISECHDFTNDGGAIFLQPRRESLHVHAGRGKLRQHVLGSRLRWPA